MSKANGQAAKMSFSGHALMEDRNGQRLRRLAAGAGSRAARVADRGARGQVDLAD